METLCFVLCIVSLLLVFFDVLTKTINLERAVWPFSHCENIRGFVDVGAILTLKHKNTFNSYTKCWNKEEKNRRGGGECTGLFRRHCGRMLFSIDTDCYV